MIVVGYQGIGKSTLAARNLKYIDLESSNFWFKDPETKQRVRHSNWYEMYCNVAEDLSRQGYIVFVSSHQPVRERLSNSKEYVIACVPSLDLKEQWIEKLKLRYETTGLEKDYKAYMNAEDRFSENITEIMNSGFTILRISNMSYELQNVIEIFISREVYGNRMKILFLLENKNNESYLRSYGQSRRLQRQDR